MLTERGVALPDGTPSVADALRRYNDYRPPVE